MTLEERKSVNSGLIQNLILENIVKIYVYEIIFIHEWNFIKFSCIKCFTNFLSGGIFTSQKDDTTKWLI